MTSGAHSAGGEPVTTTAGLPTGTHTGGPGAVDATGSTTVSRPERSLGEIFSDVTQDLSTLIRQEMELAKTELKEEVSKAGKGAGLLGGAGLAGWFTLLFLSITVFYALDEFMPDWLAALIVM